ncbi:LOW QUALITY PROTEIN: macrophage-capping protein [Acridotheres tristis]
MGCVHLYVGVSVHPLGVCLPIGVSVYLVVSIGSPFGPGATSLGLHVWRVEQLRPVQVPEATLGVVFSGDTYVVLHNGLEEQAHLHLWVGWDSPQDKRGACALLSTQLSSLLGERVTHREVQGNKSDLCMDCFPHGLTYRTLVVGCGARSNVLEHSRMQELAAASQDSERGGKAHLEIVADGKEPPELVQLLGPKPPLKEGSPEEDMVADQSNTGAAVLYKARTWQYTIMAPELGIPKCHHAGHRRYMRLGTARVHHDGPQEHMSLDMAQGHSGDP